MTTGYVDDSEPKMTEDELVEEQIKYYRARAAEYDEWHLRRGRYDRGDEHRDQWFRELNLVRDALTSHEPLGTTLELACGTGLWTPQLAKGSTFLTAVDAVAETIEINRLKTGDGKVEFRVADIFRWRPERQYDFVFFGFWLSHVPATRFADFWNVVRRSLRASGRVFFVDSLETQSSTATDHALIDSSGMVERKLNDGRTFHVVKRFYDADSLKRNLGPLGWKADVKTTGDFFLYGTAVLEGDA